MDNLAILDSWPYIVPYVIVGIGSLVVWISRKVSVLTVGGLTVSAVTLDTRVRFCVMVVKVSFVLGNFGFLFRADYPLRVKQAEATTLV